MTNLMWADVDGKWGLVKDTRKKWIGLTMDEFVQIRNKFYDQPFSMMNEVAEKLKEKNFG